MSTSWRFECGIQLYLISRYNLVLKIRSERIVRGDVAGIERTKLPLVYTQLERTSGQPKPLFLGFCYERNEGEKMNGGCFWVANLISAQWYAYLGLPHPKQAATAPHHNHPPGNHKTMPASRPTCPCLPGISFCPKWNLSRKVEQVKLLQFIRQGRKGKRENTPTNGIWGGNLSWWRAICTSSQQYVGVPGNIPDRARRWRG